VIDYRTAYTRTLEAIESSLALTLTQQDTARWQAKVYPESYNADAALAAHLTVRNLVRAELGLEPIVPSGQLDLLGGVAS
jgi:hypothetical protein